MTVPCTEVITPTRLSKSDEAIEEGSQNISIVPKVFVGHQLSKDDVHLITIATSELMCLIEGIVLPRMKVSFIAIRTTLVERGKGDQKLLVCEGV